MPLFLLYIQCDNIYALFFFSSLFSQCSASFCCIAIYLHIFPPFLDSHPSRSPQTSLWYTTGSHQLPIPCIAMNTCQSKSPTSSHTFSSFGDHMFVLYVSISISYTLFLKLVSGSRRGTSAFIVHSLTGQETCNTLLIALRSPYIEGHMQMLQLEVLD